MNYFFPDSSPFCEFQDDSLLDFLKWSETLTAPQPHLADQLTGSVIGFDTNHTSLVCDDPLLSSLCLADAETVRSSPIEDPAIPAVDVEPAKPKKKQFHCTWLGCDKVFSTSGHLSRHRRIHLCIKDFHCPHPGCGKQFARRDNMRQHYKSHFRGRNRSGESINASHFSGLF